MCANVEFLAGNAEQPGQQQILFLKKEKTITKTNSGQLCGRLIREENN